MPGLRPSTRALHAFASLLLAAAGVPAAAQWSFTEVAAAAGLAGYTHGYPGGFDTDAERMVGGAAAEDIDHDGLLDLYVVRGELGPDALLRNMGDGTFAPFPSQPASSPWPRSGATFADLDGDGWHDLIVGSLGDGFDDPDPKLFRCTGPGTFVAVADAGGLALGTPVPRPIFSTALGDYDLDGDLDIALTHWGVQPSLPGATLRRNDGAMTLTDVTGAAGLVGPTMFGFTPNFADLDDDGWPDLLVAADFGTSTVFMSDQDGTFTRTNDPEITDENGMGAAVADFDRDGDLDWFVSSIHDPDGTPEGNWGTTGNRLYSGNGDGTFTDVTTAAGVRDGFWGWGSCFADFNNDGLVDLFHTNGWSPAQAPEFHADPSRLFVQQPGGGFVEEAALRGIVDTGQGRGAVCFDYDRDGDVDILVANNDGPLRLFRNDLAGTNHWLTVRLAGDAPNTAGIGARVSVTAGGVTQLAEIRAGSNYVSSDPSELHVGLGAAAVVDELRVDWPLGGTTFRTALAADRVVTVSASAAPPPAVAPTHLAAKLDAAGSSLRVDWDATGCAGAVDHRIVWGFGASLPSLSGGAFGVDGAACGIGTGGSHVWSGVPDPSGDPDGLLWWIVVADDGATTESGWGAARRGPAPFGASGLCGATRRDLTADCAP